MVVSRIVDLAPLMAMIQHVLQRTRAPRALRFTMAPGNTDFLPETATAVSLEVRTADGVSSSWDVAIVSTSEDGVVCRHVFDAGGDETADPGTLSLLATVETPAGPYDSPVFFLVVDER